MPEVIAIVIGAAVALIVTVKIVASRDRLVLKRAYRTAHPTLEDRKQTLLQSFTTTEMTTETYERKLAELEGEGGA